MYWGFLLIAMTIAVLGQGLLKAGASAGTFVAQLFDWRTIVGLFAYGVSSILYIAALRRIPLSVALPANALSYVAVAAIGFIMFNEPVSAQRIAGLVLIAVGVLVLASST